LAGTSKNPYDLLGVRPTSSERDIRRAYRKRVVTTHRSRVLDLIDRLKELNRAYETLKDPAQRRALDANPYSWAQPSLSSGRPSPELARLRSNAAREMQRHSDRVGRVAKRENEPIVRELSNDFERREAAQRAARRRRKRLEFALRLVAMAALIALAIFAKRRLGF
jgi:curved DNA-binding protein CbpA